MKVKTHFHYILFHKPYGVLSQFTPESGHRSLQDFGPFPKGVYPVGRLDVDSEGLILLTNDHSVKHKPLTFLLSYDTRFGYAIGVSNTIISRKEVPGNMSNGIALVTVYPLSLQRFSSAGMISILQKM